ncbi:CsbD family protein [Rhizobium sp. PL01]|uniref:CsbD family protein n=1 Tax=Rhizobium sp. PL01 TaxID=3085631 RepID=UPI002982495A|nr:CsbD family protein [Rhizobium sp. PL01]MDW5316859.1 CsbD family protein [Rhizobium sp. PL01]
MCTEPNVYAAVHSMRHQVFIRSLTIGITSDKISGKVKELAGKARHAVGNAVGNEEIDAKGVIQEAKGDAQRARGNAKEAIKKVLIACK